MDGGVLMTTTYIITVGFLPIIAEVCEVRVAVGAFDQFAGFVKTWIRGILGGDQGVGI